MRIAYVTNFFPFGTGEAFLDAESRALATLSDLTIVATRPRSVARVQNSPARALALNRRRPSFWAGALCEFLRSPAAVLRVLRAILTAPSSARSRVKNLLVFPIGLSCAALARRERFDHLHAHWLTTPSTVAYIAAQLCGIPWSVSAHRFDLFEKNMIEAKVRSARFTRVISQRSAVQLRAMLPADLHERVRVVHLGVDIPPRSAAVHTWHKPLRVLCAANLVSVKGHRYLIEALALLAAQGVAVSCDIAGDGPLLEACRAQIASAGLAKTVRLRGRVDHAELLSNLQRRAYDAVCLASIEDRNEHEGIPICLMEAMAAGVPCISTTTGSIPELITADCGILVPQKDAPALAAAITELLSNGALRARLSKAARSRIVARFSAGRRANDLLELIRRGVPVEASAMLLRALER